MSILDRFSLRGRTALVTAGAGPLFGSSISTALAEAGATLITASRSLDRNQEFAESLRSQGHDAHAMQVDIEDTGSIDQLHAQVIEKFGRLDVLVNSALARDGHTGSLESQGPEIWEHAAAGDFLTAGEKEHLAFAGKLITLEIGLRFLADFLAGDVYFKVKRDAHNLDRCRTQFALVKSMEQQEAEMNRCVQLATTVRC